MGIVKGGLFVVLSILFFMSLLIGNLFLTISWSLEYENVKPEINSIIKENTESILNEKYSSMVEHCQDKTEFVFIEQEHVFEIPCDIVSKGAESVIDYGINDIVETAYYTNYSCTFFDCFSEEKITQLFLVSEQFKNYLEGKLYFLLVTGIILILAMFVFIEKKTNLPFVIGIIFIISSLPFIKLNWIISYIFSLIPSFLNPTGSLKFLPLFFSESYTAFLISFIIGVILIITGILLKIPIISFKLSRLFSKKEITENKEFSREEVKKIVKEEVAKAKKEEKTEIKKEKLVEKAKKKEKKKSK